MVVLKTSRLVLRELVDGDLDDLAALLGDPEVVRFYPHPLSREEALAWLRRNQRRYDEDKFGSWTVLDRETGAYVGDCGLTVQRVDGVDEVEVGYHVRCTR